MGLFLWCLAAAAAACGAVRGNVADHFGGPNRSYKFLYAVVVEIDRRAFRIRFRDDAYPVLLVTDRLSLFQNLHNVLLARPTNQRGKSLVLVVDSTHGRPDQRMIARSFQNLLPTLGKANFGTGLETYNAFGLQPLRSLLHFEFNSLPFVQRLVTVGLNG